MPTFNRQTQRVALVCPHCASWDIVRDASARWSAEDQQWELSDTHDNMICQACGREFNTAGERAYNVTLFNCCTQDAEPDWSKFDGLEINCCREDDGATFTCPLYEADFFTVYGHLREGGVEAITDCSTRKLANAIAAVLAGSIEMAYPILDCCWVKA